MPTKGSGNLMYDARSESSLASLPKKSSKSPLKKLRKFFFSTHHHPVSHPVTPENFGYHLSIDPLDPSRLNHNPLYRPEEEDHVAHRRRFSGVRDNDGDASVDDGQMRDLSQEDDDFKRSWKSNRTVRTTRYVHRGTFCRLLTHAYQARSKTVGPRGQVKFVGTC